MTSFDASRLMLSGIIIVKLLDVEGLRVLHFEELDIGSGVEAFLAVIDGGEVVNTARQFFAEIVRRFGRLGEVLYPEERVLLRRTVGRKMSEHCLTSRRCALLPLLKGYGLAVAVSAVREVHPKQVAVV